MLLLWSFMLYGTTNILVYGSIFQWLRNLINTMSNNPKSFLRSFWGFLSEMLKCMMCTSTWVGFFIGGFIYSPVSEVLSITPYISWALDGMFASGVVWTINSVVEWFEENRPQQNKTL